MLIMKPYFNHFVEKMRKIKKCGIFLKLDFSFVLMFFLACFLNEQRVYLLFVLFICLHEMSHFLVAKKLGYCASRIRLNFFGASLEGLDDFSLDDEIKIVLAGPLLNFFVVILCYLSFWFYPESYHYLNEILLVNWSIFLFNFLPIFPLDFGRILLAVFSKKRMRKDALKIVKNVSIISIIFLFLIYLISFFFELNFSLGFVCVNLMILHCKSAKDTSFKRAIFIYRKFKLLSKGLIERNIYLNCKTNLSSVFKYIDDYHFVNFIFLDDSLNYVYEKSELDIYKDMGFL